MADAVHVALLKSLASCLMFLEHSPDDIVDLDSAVKAMESAAYELLKLSDTDRAALVALIQEVAESESHEFDRRFLLSMPFAVGPVEDGPTFDKPA